MKEKIVDMYLARDTEAINCSAQAYGTRLRRLAFAIVRDERGAERCENDTYLRAWDSISSKESGEFLFGYLAKITRNLALDMCIREKTTNKNEQLEVLAKELEQCLSVVDEPGSKASGKDLCHLIDIFLKMQPSKIRNLFLRRYWYVEEYQEIARRFGMNLNTVKTSLFRTRKKLREYLEQEGVVV